MSNEMNDNDDLFNFDEKYEAAFKNAEVRDGKGKRETPPDGKYQVEIAKVFVEKKNDKRNLNWHLRILNGDNQGQFLFKNSQLENEVGLSVLKGDLHVMGVTLDSLSQLKDTLPQLLDKRLLVNKVTNKANPKFYNLYFNDVLDVADDFDDTEV